MQNGPATQVAKQGSDAPTKTQSMRSKQPPPLLLPITLTLLSLNPAMAQQATELAPFNVSTSYDTYQNSFEQNGANAQLIQVSPNEHIEFDSITKSIPGFHNADSGAASFGNVYSFRGSANTPFFGPATVSIYVDGVPSLDSKSFPEELGRLSSIQFIKGGQASDIGQLATSGAIIIQTPKPNPAQALNIASVEIGTDNLRAASLYSQNRIGQSDGAYSLYLYKNRSDGFINNPEDPNSRIGMKRHEGGYLRLTLPQTFNIDSEFSISWNQARDGEQAYTPTSNPPFTVSKTFDGKTNQESVTSAIKFNKEFDKTQASWISSYTDWKIGPYTTLMEIFPDFSLDSDLGQQNKQWTHEFTYSSINDTPLSWELGAYRQERKVSGETIRGIPDVTTIEQSEFTHSIDNTALRANAKLAINETISAGAGIRWDNTSQNLYRTAIIPAPQYLEFTRKDENLQGDAFISIKLADNLSASLRAFVAEKPGGFSTYTGETQYIPFDSEQSRGLELNSEWLNEQQTIGLNLSLYSTDIDNYQIERSFTETDYFVLNAEKVSSRGGEIILWLQANDALNIQLSHAYTNTKFETYFDPFSQTSFDNNYVPYVPKNTSSIEINYKINEQFSIQNNWSFKDNVYFHEGNQAQDTADSYYTSDFWIRYKKDAISLDLGIKNLLDETYVSFINSGVFQQVNGNPRQASVRASLEF